MRRLPYERERLERAKARLDRLDLYDVPVSLARVRVLVEPRLFRVPGFRRYQGYSFWRTIVFRDEHASSDLLTHELCHIWQAQRRPFAQLWAWVRYSYHLNPFEREARAGVDATRSASCEQPTRQAGRPGLAFAQNRARLPPVASLGRPERGHVG